MQPEAARVFDVPESIEAAISLLLLFFGSIGIAGFFFNGFDFLAVHFSDLLWGFLGGIILFAWRKQRRIPEPTVIPAAK